MEKRWQTASTEDLLRGMNDINDHVRLAAVAACSKAAEVRQRKKAEQSFGEETLNFGICIPLMSDRQNKLCLRTEVCHVTFNYGDTLYKNN